MTSNGCVVNEWARVHTLSILKPVSFFDHWFSEIGCDVSFHHIFLCVVNASESDCLASASLVCVPVDGGAAESHLGPLNVPANGDVIHNSSCLCRVIPVVHSVIAHILE